MVEREKNFSLRAQERGGERETKREKDEGRRDSLSLPFNGYDRITWHDLIIAKKGFKSF